MLKCKGDDPESNSIIEETAKTLINAYDQNNINSVEDWEVDQLLDWTNALSFTELVILIRI